MKLASILLFSILLLSSCASSITKTRVAGEVFMAEKERFNLTVFGDTAALRTYLHPELLYIHSNGLEENIQDHLNNVGGGKIDYQSFTSLQRTRLKQVGKLAFVDGLVAVDGLYDGYAFTVNLRYTAIYQKSKKQWQLFRWQSTKIEED